MVRTGAPRLRTSVVGERVYILGRKSLKIQYPVKTLKIKQLNFNALFPKEHPKRGFRSPKDIEQASNTQKRIGVLL